MIQGGFHPPAPVAEKGAGRGRLKERESVRGVRVSAVVRKARAASLDPKARDGHNVHTRTHTHEDRRRRRQRRRVYDDDEGDRPARISLVLLQQQ